MELVFYQFWRSSSSWRVRWALALKGVEARVESVDLMAGQQRSPEYLAVNPTGTVPCLVIDGQPLSESVAIIEWLDERFPEPPLLPSDPLARAKCRELVQIVNAAIQPLQNPMVRKRHAEDEAAQNEWTHFFIRRGFDAIEPRLSGKTRHAVADTITMADLFLAPQCRNAVRFGLTLDPWPKLAAVNAAALETEAAKASHPRKPG